MAKQIFVHFVIGLIGSILFGFIGFAIGVTIGGSFGFPAFGGNAGYEAGGVFFAIIGISFGSLLGIMIVNKIQHRKQDYKVTSIAAIITAVIALFFFDYNMSVIVGLSILLLPAIVLTILCSTAFGTKTTNTPKDF